MCFRSDHPLAILYHALAGHVPSPPPASPPLYEDVSLWSRTILALLNNPTRFVKCG